MLEHVAIRCIDRAASGMFRDALLAPLGITRVMDSGPVVGFGTAGKPDFWIGPSDTAGVPRPSHLAFAADDGHAERAFSDSAVALGTEVLHVPRVWSGFHPDYYGVFVRDPDGNDVEAVCHAPG